MYLDWLKINVQEESIHSLERISLPFLDRHNDYISLLIIKRNDNEYLISDDGYTLNDLEMCGVYIQQKRNEQLLSIALNSNGIQLNKNFNDLYAICGKENIPQKIQNLLQCILELTHGMK